MPSSVQDVRETWPVESSRDLYRSELPFALRADAVRRPGHPAEEPFTRVVLEHPGAVVVLAVDDDERVLCLRQYRHPVGRRLIELPAGLLDLAGLGLLLAGHLLRGAPLLPRPWSGARRPWRLRRRPRGGRDGDRLGALLGAAGRDPRRARARRTRHGRRPHREGARPDRRRTGLGLVSDPC